MLVTAEVRWFNRGTIPTSIQQWFEQDKLGKYLAAPAAREDIYLYTPESEFVGIKLRQGRLEIKWRQAELGIQYFSKNVAGKAEKWGKWLCEDPTNTSFQFSDVADKKAWLSAKKTRSQRRYQFDANKSVIAVPVNEATTPGCNIELTQLTVDNDEWWSLALEASDVDTLQSVANWIFPNNSFSLQAENSYAYPTWLTLVFKNLCL